MVDTITHSVRQAGQSDRAGTVQQALDIPQRKRKSDMQHNRQAYNHGAAVKVLERVCFRHEQGLRNYPARLRTVCSGKTDFDLPAVVRRTAQDLRT